MLQHLQLEPVREARAKRPYSCQHVSPERSRADAFLEHARRLYPALVDLGLKRRSARKSQRRYCPSLRVSASPPNRHTGNVQQFLIGPSIQCTHAHAYGHLSLIWKAASVTSHWGNEWLGWKSTPPVHPSEHSRIPRGSGKTVGNLRNSSAHQNPTGMTMPIPQTLPAAISESFLGRRRIEDCATIKQARNQASGESFGTSSRAGDPPLPCPKPPFESGRG